jgi:hypothetical protein
MNADPRGFPAGELRVSDAERDQALSELSEAYRVGRISAGEFDQRSTQALSARTGKELSALVADLPHDPSRQDVAPANTATPRRADGYLRPRLIIGTALTAICFGGVAVSSALQPGVDQATTLAPAAVAVLCVGLVIALCVRGRRGPRSRSTTPPPDARSPR